MATATKGELLLASGWSPEEEAEAGVETRGTPVAVGAALAGSAGLPAAAKARPGDRWPLGADSGHLEDVVTVV